MGSKGLSYVGKNFTSTILPLVKTTILPMVAKTVGSTSIAGIAIGGTTGSLSIVLISVAAYFLYRKRKKVNVCRYVVKKSTCTGEVQMLFIVY